MVNKSESLTKILQLSIVLAWRRGEGSNRRQRMADKQSAWQENKNYLSRMANMAKKRSGFLQRYKNQWKEDWYVRIARDSYRAYL